jgi:hypothetical protein
MIYFSRRSLLASAGLALFGTVQTPRQALAEDVVWLSDVQQPPDRAPSAQHRLSPLLIDAEGKPINSAEAWRNERQRLRKAWLSFLGPMSAERPPVRWDVLGEERIAGCTRQLLRYESEAGIPVEGYLLRPDEEVPGRDPATRKRPALVALHPTSKDTIDEIAGVRGADDRQLGLKLARRGFVVFCPRCFLWQSAENYTRAVENFRERHPNTLGMHKMLWDAMRGVDVLETLAEVDPKRIGAVGHSLGAKETLYLAAFDERIAAAIASESGIGLSFTNWDAAWYLGPAIKAADFKLDHHQLLALIAPRPFLILAGESGNGAADGDRTWPYVEAALGVYRLYGSPARLGLYNHRQGHTISDATFERLTEWLTTYLRVTQ